MERFMVINNVLFREWVRIEYEIYDRNDIRFFDFQLPEDVFNEVMLRNETI